MACFDKLITRKDIGNLRNREKEMNLRMLRYHLFKSQLVGIMCNYRL